MPPRPEEQALFIAQLRGIAPAMVSKAPALSRRNAPELTGLALHATLPLQPCPFIGRVRELTLLAALRGESDTCVVTIVAPGGMGKSRLALAALAQAQGASRFANGTVYVSLAPLGAAAQLDMTLATALNLPLTTTAPASRSTRHQILDYLRTKQLLLLLDNCEHLREEVAELVIALLAEAPGVTLLLTSRERLGLRAERPFVLGGMDPEAEGRVLFAASARVIDPTFTLDAASEPLVTAICVSSLAEHNARFRGLAELTDGSAHSRGLPHIWLYLHLLWVCWPDGSLRDPWAGGARRNLRRASAERLVDRADRSVATSPQ